MNRGLRASWGIMGNQGKRKQDGGCVQLVMLAKLNCFDIVYGFSLVKRKTDLKNSSLENIGNYFDINRCRKIAMIHFLKGHVEPPRRTRRMRFNMAKHLDFLDLSTGILGFIFNREG